MFLESKNKQTNIKKNLVQFLFLYKLAMCERNLTL